MSKWQKVGLFGALVGASMSVGLALKGLWDEWREDRVIREVRTTRMDIMDHEKDLYADLIAQNQKMLNDALQRSKEP